MQIQIRILKHRGDVNILCLARFPFPYWNRVRSTQGSDIIRNHNQKMARVEKMVKNHWIFDCEKMEMRGGEAIKVSWYPFIPWITRAEWYLRPFISFATTSNQDYRLMDIGTSPGYCRTIAVGSPMVDCQFERQDVYSWSLLWYKWLCQLKLGNQIWSLALHSIYVANT